MKIPETDEQRIKRLEATVDILKDYLLITNELLQATLYTNTASSSLDDRHFKLAGLIEENLANINKLHPCKRNRNNWH